MAKSFESLAKLDKNTEVGESRDLAANDVARTVRRDKAFPRARREVLHRQRKPLAALVDIGDDRLDFLVFLQNVLRMLDLLGPRDIRNMDKPVDAFFKLDKRAKVGDVSHAAVNLATDRIAEIDRVPRIVLELLHAEADAFFDRVDAEHLHLDLLALMEQALRALRTARPRDLRNMNEALDAGFELDKNAVIGDRRDNALELGIDRIDLNDR